MEWLQLPSVVVILAASLLVTSAYGQIYLALDLVYSPPAIIPEEGKDLIYSSPEMDHMLKPIKVWVLHTSNNSAVMEPVLVVATTILGSNGNVDGNPGDWYDGELCQHAFWFNRFWFPRYYMDGGVEMHCNKTDPLYPNGKVENWSENGMAEFPRLLHTKYFNETRRIRFFVTYNGVTSYVTTNPIRVDMQAAAINITSSVPDTVYVNQPLTITVETLAVDPNDPTNLILLTEGRHSSLHIDLTIGWEFKSFYIFFPTSVNCQELKQSNVTLASKDAHVNGMYDTVVRKRAVNGQATFEDIRILNIYSNVVINVTQLLPYDPWERWPPIYNDTIDYIGELYFHSNDSSNSPAVAVTSRFNVIASEISSLEIDSDSLISFGANVDANFPLKPDLIIKALDSDGRLITDGPDSELTVDVAIDPIGECISSDASFTLMNGQGTFLGSVCTPVDNVMLRFSTVATNGTTIYSEWTPQFNVSGILRVAGIFPIYYESGLPILYEAAKQLINQGYFNQEFIDQGRMMVNEFFMAPTGTVQETLEIYEEIQNRNMDPEKGSIRAIIGSVENEQTVALSRFSKMHQMPIIGYTADDGELSDKSVHPYFNRVSIAQNMKFYAMGIFLASHHWNKIIVIKDNDHPIPPIMYQGLEAHGVQIVLEVTVPTVESESDFDGLRPLDEEAEKIENVGTKIIYSYTFAPSDLYLYHEAIRLKFAPIFGYQWLTEFSIMMGFPWMDIKGNCNERPTCTESFNSTIVLYPGFKADLTKGFWNETLFDAYTHIEPTLTPGSPIYRWPSVLGFNTLAHDATVAAFLGAVRIIDRQETITGPKLAEEIRMVTFIGGSGNVSFDVNGDRPGFSATIYQMKPVWANIEINNDFVFVAGYYFVDAATEEAIQSLSWQRSLTTGFANDTMNYAPSNYTNIRRFKGYWEGSEDSIQMFEMRVPAAYYCSDGCGGGLSDDANGTIYYYNYGECIAQDSCMCKTKPGSVDEPGYAGRSCDQPLCDPQCRNGQCISPDVCNCDAGWSGNDCSTPICYPECVFGTCTGPGTCDCDSGYWDMSCSKKCSCENGKCNDGQSGTGTCSSCNGGWSGSDCNISIPLVVVPSITVSILIIVAIIILTIWYIRRMRFIAALSNNDWMVNYDDLIIIQDDKGAASSMAFRSMISMKSDSKKQKNLVRNQGKWKDTPVAIKMISKESLTANTQLRLEIKAMRDLRHPNLAQFVGACIDSPNVCILMEIAPKGSLDDLLANESLNLDWNFKYSLLKDICKGMIYLSNSPIKSHGRLKSSNCVVDNRWTLKLTDYGMITFKANQQGVPKLIGSGGAVVEKGQFVEDVEDGFNDATIKQALLYTAPEILATGITHPDHVESGTLQGDVYSFALVMFEMLTKEPAYNEYMDYMEIDEVLDCISGRRPVPQQVWQQKGRIGNYLRPTSPSEKESLGFVKLMEQSWSEDPQDRPTFQSILKQLNSLSPQQGDLMDNLVSMLEKYSTNLEAIVAERTAELAAEKQKTEDLVCRMLPKAIAEQLKQGQPVKAESFECVTIYFSDIVGFTAIAGSSTPFQVVDLLNDLYTCFDAIIDHFDVYKVETIGDAYMVVSGLPTRNGDNHAGEIASMSLHLLSAILDFKIRHLPEKKLQLRIGMHSGPAVAGVVGLKMPRYCLFGDTVNTASRMESGGLALRVHLSENTAVILERLGGYDLQLRGTREVKGKGTMTTYWLKGKQGFNRPLPTEEMAVSESQHEFK